MKSNSNALCLLRVISLVHDVENSHGIHDSLLVFMTSRKDLLTDFDVLAELYCLHIFLYNVYRNSFSLSRAPFKLQNIKNISYH